MSDITRVTTNELVKDYYESQTERATSKDEKHKRKNEHYMKAIAAELDRRGELHRIVN